MAVVDDIDLLEDDRGSSRNGSGGMFGVVFDPRTYGSILYMLLALPLGIAYFTFVAVGASLSIGLLILIVGVLVALFFITLTRGISTVEGYITGALLGARIPHCDDVDAEFSVDGDEADSDQKSFGFWAWIKQSFTDLRTWTSMVYMALMLPLGTAYFTIAVTGFATSLAFIFAPFAQFFGEEVHMHVMDADADAPAFIIQLSEFFNTPLGLVAMVVLGFVGLFLMLYVSRGIGWLHARLAETMLVKRS